MPFDFKKYYKELDWPEKRKVQHIQFDLLEEGYAKDATFVAKECLLEAIRRFRKEQNDGKTGNSEKNIGRKGISRSEVGHRF